MAAPRAETSIRELVFSLLSVFACVERGLNLSVVLQDAGILKVLKVLKVTASRFEADARLRLICAAFAEFDAANS